MLKQRVLAATILTLALAAALWLDLDYFQDSLMLHILFLIGAYFSFREFWPMCRATGHQTFSVWGTLSGCGLVAVHYEAMRLSVRSASLARLQMASDLLWGALALAVLGAFILTARRRQFEASLGGVAVTCLGLLYIYFLPSFLLKLRHVGADGLLGGRDWNGFGHRMVLATIILAKGCDVWAYLVGRLVGRHKAFPALSPGKTVEGAAAGLGGSVLVALLLHWDQVGVLSSFTLTKACILGFCIGLAGMMGDLSESLLKRSAGAKDAGDMVPGYGGMMDVVDSFMVAGPVAYFLIPVMI
jgi:phosphatidate cytidylyltransferase